MTDSFNHEAVYDQQIAPLMSQIIEICKAHKIPMVASFMYGYDRQDGERRDTCDTIMTHENPVAAVYQEAMRHILSRPFACAITVTRPQSSDE